MACLRHGAVKVHQGNAHVKTRHRRAKICQAPRAVAARLAWRIEPLEPRRLLSGKTIDVDAAAPGPAHDGTTWATA